MVTEDDIISGRVAKKVVYYSRLMRCVVGERAECIPTNHTNSVFGQHVRNGEYCSTSPVLAYNEATGEFETTYSFYKPEPPTDYYTFN